MTIEIRPLQTIDDLRAAVNLQQHILGEHASGVWRLPQLVDIQHSSGLLLGAQVAAPQSHDSLDAILIDLLSTVEGYAARRTIAWAVCPQRRSQGIGTKLRIIERAALQRDAVDLVYWDVDPLNSIEIYIALNKLGGILVGYHCNMLGSSRDGRAPGLATDRVRCEWWIDSPRVVGILDHGKKLPHHTIGLNEMTVLTKTTVLQTGLRGVVESESPISGNHVLVEIPERLDELQVRDYAAAIQWRLQSRRLMEQLFGVGYMGVGLIHEGGRSFLLFTKGTRRTELSATGK
mgnify:CR=1 FL=1